MINFNKSKHTQLYKNLVQTTLEKGVEILQPPYPNVEISVAFVSARYIKKLNRKFRNINKVTDVLSFPFFTLPEKEQNVTDALLQHPHAKTLFLGDIYICVKRAKKQAKQYNHPATREVAYLALHGLLHLFGYHHSTPEDKKLMRQHEETILSAVGLSRAEAPVKVNKLSIG